jgi:hypothetical protein
MPSAVFRVNIPNTAGARVLIWMPALSTTLAVDRTSPTTPNLDAAYKGAIGSGYSPALDAVQMIDPRHCPCCGFLFM